MNFQRQKNRAWLQVLSFWAATELRFPWSQYIFPNKYFFLEYGMQPPLNLLILLPTAIQLKHTLSLSSMAIRLFDLTWILQGQCLQGQWYKVPWRSIFLFYNCIFVFWILESSSSTEVLLQLQVRLFERTKNKCLLRASLQHTPVPAFPDCSVKGGSMGWKLHGNLPHSKVSKFFLVFEGISNFPTGLICLTSWKVQ